MKSHPHSVGAYLKAIGRKGGKVRAKTSTPAALSAQARYAVVSRWMRKRFGATTFEALALPGWEIVDSGLRDLVSGNFSSVNALAVAELRPKLRFLGVPVPTLPRPFSEPRSLLYRSMEEKDGDMAHARFCALLGRLDSFCDALAATASIPRQATHRHRRWHA